MPDSQRPSLKLTFGKKTADERPLPPQQPQQPPATPAAETPRLTLKMSQKSQTPQTGQKPKKKTTSKKRPADEPALSDSDPGEPAPSAPAKRLKLNPAKSGLRSIRIRNKQVVPTRPVGVGYDDEASDTELDPSIEEQFILRMAPGADCEWLRQAIDERKIQSGDIGIKALTREGRRAVLKVRNNTYAAALVDLPCIVEGMKSWDKRGWYKSADICQMLLVLGMITNERDAYSYPFPRDVEVPDDKTLSYPHGLTPPLRWVKKRRFRNRVSARTIEQVERAVEDLVHQDQQAVGPVQYELLDSASVNRAEGYVQNEQFDEDEYYDDEQDAEGEAEEGMMGAEDFEAEDALAAEMEAALAGEDDTTAPAAPEAGPSDVYQAGTPAAMKHSSPGETSGDEEEMSAQEDEVPEDELDDEQLERQRQLQEQREEIAELETLIRSETSQWERMPNAILKNKMAKRIQDLKRDLSLKKVSIGEGDDADA